MTKVEYVKLYNYKARLLKVTLFCAIAGLINLFVCIMNEQLAWYLRDRCIMRAWLRGSALPLMVRVLAILHKYVKNKPPIIVFKRK